MIGKLVMLYDCDKPFYIIDVIIELGDTKYIGLFDGEDILSFVSPCSLKSIVKQRNIAK